MCVCKKNTPTTFSLPNRVTNEGFFIFTAFNDGLKKQNKRNRMMTPTAHILTTVCISKMIRTSILAITDYPVEPGAYPRMHRDQGMKQTQKQWLKHFTFIILVTCRIRGKKKLVLSSYIWWKSPSFGHFSGSGLFQPIEVHPGKDASSSYGTSTLTPTG